jgi:hypothetical protein
MTFKPLENSVFSVPRTHPFLTDLALRRGRFCPQTVTESRYGFIGLDDKSLSINKIHRSNLDE